MNVISSNVETVSGKSTNSNLGFSIPATISSSGFCSSATCARRLSSPPINKFEKEKPFLDTEKESEAIKLFELESIAIR